MCFCLFFVICIFIEALLFFTQLVQLCASDFHEIKTVQQNIEHEETAKIKRQLCMNLLNSGKKNYQIATRLILLPDELLLELVWT